MKILHFDSDDLGDPLCGGAARVTFEVSRRIARHHDITVVTANYHQATNVVTDGVHYRRAGRFRRYPWNKLAFLCSAPLLARQAPGIDLVVESFGPPLTCLCIPAFTGKPVVAQVPYIFGRELGEKYRIPLRFLEAQNVKLYKYFIVPAAHVARRIREYNSGAEIAVIPYGVEDQFFTLEPAAGTYLAFVGRVDIFQKGLDLLLSALASIPEGRRPPLRIFGTGRDESRLRHLALSFGVSSVVRFMGRVTGQRRLDAIAGARAVCVPSRFETFGLGVVEALAAGRPVIGFTGVGFEEIFGDARCGYLVQRGNVRALADAMLVAWENCAESGKLGLVGRDRARAFNWDSLAPQYSTFYERVASDAF